MWFLNKLFTKKIDLSTILITLKTPHLSKLFGQVHFFTLINLYEEILQAPCFVFFIDFI